MEEQFISNRDLPPQLLLYPKLLFKIATHLKAHSFQCTSINTLPFKLQMYLSRIIFQLQIII